jgi:hypothetical protein
MAAIMAMEGGNVMVTMAMDGATTTAIEGANAMQWQQEFTSMIEENR